MAVAHGAQIRPVPVGVAQSAQTCGKATRAAPTSRSRHPRSIVAGMPSTLRVQSMPHFNLAAPPSRVGSVPA